MSPQFPDYPDNQLDSFEKELANLTKGKYCIAWELHKKGFTVYCSNTYWDHVRLLHKAKLSTLDMRLENHRDEIVNHPPHYGKDTPYEVIKVLEQWLTAEEFIGAMKFNIFKYNARAKFKGEELENYQKAQFYQNYLIEFLRRQNEKQSNRKQNS